MTERNCKTCACYTEVTLNPLAPPQSQCRRNGPMPAQIRIERPMMRKNLQTGQMEPKIDKATGQPLVEASIENVFLYAPTAPDSVCFDGWRPIGTPPGRPFTNAELDSSWVLSNSPRD